MSRISALEDRDKVLLAAALSDLYQWQQLIAAESPGSSIDLVTEILRWGMPNHEVEAIQRLIHNANKGQLEEREPDYRCAEIVQTALMLAAGGQQPCGEAVLPVLVSIFHHIGSGPKVYQPLCRLTPEGYRFPNQERTDHIESYRHHLQSMKEEIAKLQHFPFSPDQLMFFLRKYLWCLPAATGGAESDVSSYEYSKLAAALAVSMYDYLQDHPEENVDQRSSERYILLVGDLSGIQRYLYTVGTKGAVRALKGRSFTLQLLTETIAIDMLRQLGYSLFHLLYSGGGKFFVLLPNIHMVREKLQRLQEKVEKFFLKRYNAILTLVFGNVAFSGEDLMTPQGVAALWGRAIASAKRAQLQQFQTQVRSVDFFLNPQAPFGRTVRCQVTNVDLCTRDQWEAAQRKEAARIGPLKVQRRYLNGWHCGSELIEDPEEGSIIVAPEQEEAQRLGHRLRSDVNVVGIGPIENGVPIYDSYRIAIEKSTEKLPSSIKIVQFVNHDDFLSVPVDAVTGWRFYAGTWIPQEQDKIRDFTTLVQHAKGLKRLAVLRMDVDNLGQVFARGFGQYATFARIMQLSTMMDFFFGSYINRLGSLYWSLEKGVQEQAADGEPLRQQLFIVYAGGDDLFMVGPWHIMPDVALWIRKEFHRFTGHNPALTISGGLALFDDKFPLFRAAEWAKAAEEKAKRYQRVHNDKSKDAITVWDVPLDWQDLVEARELACRWIDWIERAAVPKQFLQRIIQLYRRYQREQSAYGAWRWRGAYHLARLAERVNEEGIKQEIHQIAAEGFVNAKAAHGARQLQILYVAALWTVSYTRTES